MERLRCGGGWEAAAPPPSEGKRANEATAPGASADKLQISVSSRSHGGEMTEFPTGQTGIIASMETELLVRVAMVDSRIWLKRLVRSRFAASSISGNVAPQCAEQVLAAYGDASAQTNRISRCKASPLAMCGPSMISAWHGALNEIPAGRPQSLGRA